MSRVFRYTRLCQCFYAVCIHILHSEIHDSCLDSVDSNHTHFLHCWLIVLSSCGMWVISRSIICQRSTWFRWIAGQGLTVGTVVNPRAPSSSQLYFGRIIFSYYLNPTGPSTDLPLVNLIFSYALRTTNGWTMSHDDPPVIFGCPRICFASGGVNVNWGMLGSISLLPSASRSRQV